MAPLDSTNIYSKNHDTSETPKSDTSMDVADVSLDNFSETSFMDTSGTSSTVAEFNTTPKSRFVYEEVNRDKVKRRLFQTEDEDSDSDSMETE